MVKVTDKTIDPNVAWFKKTVMNTIKRLPLYGGRKGHSSSKRKMVRIFNYI